LRVKKILILELFTYSLAYAIIWSLLYTVQFSPMNFVIIFVMVFLIHAVAFSMLSFLSRFSEKTEPRGLIRATCVFFIIVIDLLFVVCLAYFNHHSQGVMREFTRVCVAASGARWFIYFHWRKLIAF